MPTTANEALRDALIKHQVYLLRYSGFLRNEMADMLNKVESEIAAKIIQTLGNSKGFDKPSSVRKLEGLLDAIDKIRSGAWTGANEFLLEQMREVAQKEPVFAQGIFAANSPVILDMVLPPARQLKAIAESKPFEGRILKEWAETMQAEDLRRIHSAIQLGMISGEGSDEIARRVIGTKALSGTDGATEITRRQVQAITRTAVQHVANSAREEMFRDNVDVLTAELFVATLDSRTTPICRSLDGKVFDVSQGPKPPLHFSCRSLRVAAMDGERLGMRPSKPVTQKILLREFTEKNNLDRASNRDDLPKGFKGKFDAFERKRVRELVGRVPAATSYQEWLKGQSHEFQNEILGLTKAKLFRDGGLTLDKYVAANGTELSLSQLATKYSAAFKLAGLDPSVFR